MEAVGEAKVEWMTSSDIQASDEEVFNYTTILPIKGIHSSFFPYWLIRQNNIVEHSLTEKSNHNG